MLKLRLLLIGFIVGVIIGMGLGVNIGKGKPLLSNPFAGVRLEKKIKKTSGQVLEKGGKILEDSGKALKKKIDR